MKLSPIQVQVLRLLCAGMQNKRVSFELHISERTVEDYRADIMRRTGSKNAVQLGVWAALNGILEKASVAA